MIFMSISTYLEHIKNKSRDISNKSSSAGMTFFGSLLQSLINFPRGRDLLENYFLLSITLNVFYI
jgi:hypothetical protein